MLAEKLDFFIIVFPDNILIYTGKETQSHVKAIC